MFAYQCYSSATGCLCGAALRMLIGSEFLCSHAGFAVKAAYSTDVEAVSVLASCFGVLH